jgi:integrase
LQDEGDDGLKTAPLGSRPHWDETTLTIAKAVEKGEAKVTIRLPDPAGWLPASVAVWWNELVSDFPMVQLQPSEPAILEDGRQHWLGVSNRHRRISEGTTNFSATGGQTLHPALDDYALWIRSKYVAINEEGERHVSDWGRLQLGHVERLKAHHPDIPLAALTLSEIEQFLNHWAQRPPVKGTTKPISFATAEHHIYQLKNSFCNWLHRSEKYDWKKPADLADIRVKILVTQSEKNGRATPFQVDTYSVEELTILYRIAIPRERLFLLLALNCGFNIEELSSLRWSEICLETKHPQAKRLSFFSTDSDSFIFRVRGKTGVYGEWKLWPATVAGLKDHLRHTKGQRVFSTPKGKALTAQTEGGNRGRLIDNTWNRLLDRVQKTHPEFRRLSFGKLRKTAGNLARDIAGGEVFGIFIAHGQPVKTDDLAELYSNKPFAKVFKACDGMAKHLAPMFAAVPEPFPKTKTDFRGNPGLSAETIAKIVELRAQGYKAQEVAEKLGITKKTVIKYRNGAVKPR